MLSFILSRRGACASLLVLAVAACSGETKPSAADAKVPDKSAPPVADKTPEPGADAAAPVKTVEGDEPGGDQYALRVDAAEAAVGRETSAKITVVPKAPWHMNLDFPTSLTLTAPEGLTLAKADLKKADAAKLDEASAEFDIKFTAANAGEHTVSGKFKFAVCQDEACVPVTEDLTIKVAAK